MYVYVCRYSIRMYSLYLCMVLVYVFIVTFRSAHSPQIIIGRFMSVQSVTVWDRSILRQNTEAFCLRLWLSTHTVLQYSTLACGAFGFLNHQHSNTIQLRRWPMLKQGKYVLVIGLYCFYNICTYLWCVQCPGIFGLWIHMITAFHVFSNQLKKIPVDFDQVNNGRNCFFTSDIDCDWIVSTW